MSSADHKWVVYRRGEPIGAFTAEEIREELRRGVLKPTDFASAESSMIRLQIIEIDEIFGDSADLKVTDRDTPKQSRWADRAAALNLASAPVTQPRPQPIQKPHPHPQRKRPRPEQNYRRTAGQMQRTRNDAWILTVLISLVATAMLLYWLKARR